MTGMGWVGVGRGEGVTKTNAESFDGKMVGENSSDRMNDWGF